MKKEFLFIGIAVILAAVIGYTLWPNGQSVGTYYNEGVSSSYTATSTVTSTPVAFNIKGKQNLTIAVVGTNATATVKFAGSVRTTAPDPLTASGANNQWGYVQLIDLDNGVTVNGSTGLSLTVGTTSKMYKLTQTNLSFLTPVITAYTTGTVKVIIASDEGSNK